MNRNGAKRLAQRKPAKVVVGTQVEEADRLAVVRLARLTGRTVSEVMREAIRLYVLSQERLVAEAEAEFDAGLRGEATGEVVGDEPAAEVGRRRRRAKREREALQSHEVAPPPPVTEPDPVVPPVVADPRVREASAAWAALDKVVGEEDEEEDEGE